MNKKYKNVCRVFNYTDHSLTVVSTITGCVSISAFACLVGIQQGLRILQLELKNYAITARIERYKSKIKKKKKRHHKIVLLAKSKLKSIEILISKTLIQSNISHDEFVLINKVLKELCDFQEEMEKSYNK